jgi:uncharacterized protein YdcH (DUF465 family)
MLPPQFSPVPIYPTNQIQIDRVKAQHELYREFISSVADVVRQRHATAADRLEKAWLALHDNGFDEYIAELERAQTQRYTPPAPPPGYLESLVERHNTLEDQIDKIEKGIEDLPEAMQGMMEATGLTPLRQQMKNLEAEIAMYTKEVVATFPRTAGDVPTPEETGFGLNGG